MFFDGASNFKGVRIGAVLIFETSQHYHISAKIRFPYTNNMAEYEACILGLRVAVDMNIKEILVISDSDLLVHQVLGEWTTKNVKILPYLHCVKELCKQFTEIDFKHVSRIPNKFADAFATLSSMIQHPKKNYIDPIKVEIHDQQAYCFHVDEELDGQPWYYDTKKLLETREYPENATNKQNWTLRRMANHFFLDGEILYRRTSDLGLLRCVDTAEATRLLEEVHAGTCGPHINGFTLAKKTLRVGYYWITMERDNIRHVQKCHQCEVHGDFIRVPLNELHVEASTYKAVTKKVVADFVRNNIVCRFGIPESIIIANAANINSDLMRETCEKFWIAHRNSTAYQPQMNRAVKAANKNIKKILRKITDSHRQWHEKLPYALLGYRTMARTSTGATPYMLVYGSEAVIPAEVEIPSLRIIQDVGLEDIKWIHSRHEQLMLIEKKRMDAVSHGQLYQNRMSKALNKRVRPRKFESRQLVLKRILPHHDEAKGKFAPNCQGPYVVHRVLLGRALILAEIDGKVSTKPINSDSIKKYYI
ncbi:uncharacterized protein LOC132639610 [Lycium barbarum]|uniref:uncharacterized protein LOC132639610 n=1 Tax=Lycium barbarum TaxID=112863 RepID=UPI00293EFAFB|nr:uncharacterized protein LOC132639610 [Lycium barbarum]